MCAGAAQSWQRVTRGTKGNVVHRLTVALVDRGTRLTHAEDKTVELLQKAQHFGDTAHKVTLVFM